MDKVLDTCNLPSLTQENINRLITSDVIEAVIRILISRKCQGPDGFPTEFYKTLKKELTPELQKHLKRN